MNDVELWRTRASAWELLSVSFRYPSEELANAVASGEWADAAREIAMAIGVDLPASFADGVSGADAEETFHLLRREATRLFIGAPAPAVLAYEGLALSPDDPRSELMYVNDRAMSVERFCAECGFGRPEGTNEPLDHIASECELLEYLALAASGVEFPNVVESKYPGGSSAAAYESFKAWHFDAWAQAFAEEVRREARHPFYRDAAMLLALFAPKLSERQATERNSTE